MWGLGLCVCQKVNILIDEGDGIEGLGSDKRFPWLLAVLHPAVS